jgi:hypothetical protein
MIEDFIHNNNEIPRRLLINPISYQVLLQSCKLDSLDLEVRESDELELHELVVY